MAVDLGPITDFEDGRLAKSEVDGKEFGVLRWGEDVYVFRDVCPHMNAPLSRGICLARVVEDDGVGSLALDPLAPVVSCPWHRWEFSLSNDGTSLRDERFRVKMYPAWAEDGRLVAELPTKRQTEEPVR